MFIRTHLVRYITFGFAAGISLYPFVLVRPKQPLTRRFINHERIHLRQQAELWIFPFYLLYFSEYFYRLINYRNHNQAYNNISFEKEAYSNEANPFYLENRKWGSWFKYL